MTLTQDKISRLRKLTALALTKEVTIDSVLDSVSSLQGLEIPSHLTTTRSGQGTLLLRPDIVKGSEDLPDMLLHCSGQRVVGHQIALSSIMHGE